MDTIELNLKTKRENEEIVSGFLFNYDLDGLSIEDDKLLYDLAQEEDKEDLVGKINGYSDYIIIKVFFPEDDYQAFIKDEIRSFIDRQEKDGIAIEVVKEEVLVDKSWATEWMKYYKVLHIASFAIVPEWEDYEAKEGEEVIKINPGLAFGTGTHATTSMCLEYMEEMDIEGKRGLDMGCGSGILSIAAEKLGASEVLAADYDELAIEKTKENIALNSSSRIETVKSDLTSSLYGKFDFAMVNIIAEVIVKFIGQVGDYLNPGAQIVFSGILEERLDLVLDALEGSFKIEGIKRQEGWCAIKASYV